MTKSYEAMLIILITVFRPLLEHRIISLIWKVQVFYWTGWMFQGECMGNFLRVCPVSIQCSQRVMTASLLNIFLTVSFITQCYVTMHQMVDIAVGMFCSKMGCTYVLRHWLVDLPLVYHVCWDVCTSDEEQKVLSCSDESEFVRENATHNFYW